MWNDESLNHAFCLTHPIPDGGSAPEQRHAEDKETDLVSSPR
jgi:hypothetical protein